MKIAFALGGGGAKGYAHIGVLKALKEAGIAPDMIVGTSMGSVVGAMFCQLGDIDKVEKRARDFIVSEDFHKLGMDKLKRNPDEESFFGNLAKKIEGRIIVNLSYSQRSLFKQELFVKALDKLIDPCLIEELPLKYAAVTGDLKTGDKVVLTSGELKTAVLASSSIPGFLEPVEYGRWELTDGEVSDLVPCMTAKELGGEFIIAVDVGEGLTLSHPLENALDIIFRANHIKGRALVEVRKKYADVWIHPNVDSYKWSDFDQIDPLVKNGYTAGKAAISEIQRKLKAKKWRFWERMFRK